MSTELVKASVTPPPTKHELRVAAARVISRERIERNKKRVAAIQKAQDELEKAVIKAGRAAVRKAKPSASHGYAGMHEADVWSVYARAEVKIEGDLLPLRAELHRLIDIPIEETDEREIVRQLREREAGISTTPKDRRIESIIATPALRKAVKEFGEKLLATPTPTEKATAIEVGGGL